MHLGEEAREKNLMDKKELLVNEGVPLVGPLLVFLMQVNAALTGAKKGREEKRRQDVQDERDRADQFKADAEMWRSRAEEALKECDAMQGKNDRLQGELDARNADWVQKQTNYPEVSNLTSVPGAMLCVREDRDNYLAGTRR